MSEPQLDTSLLTQLEGFDTPTVCNAIELFDVVPRNQGYMNGSIKCCFPGMKPMVGIASTATFRSYAQPRGNDVYASLSKQAEILEGMDLPSVVVFQDLDEPVCAATFGEVMCTTYQAFGAKGLVTSGAGRDLEQVRDLGFPVFTGSSIASHGYCHILDLELPVTVGGICVRPGDLLHGDENGVATVPLEIAGLIPAACRGIMDAEQIVLDYLKTGQPTAKGFDEARTACGKQISALSVELKEKAGLTN